MILQGSSRWRYSNRNLSKKAGIFLPTDLPSTDYVHINMNCSFLASNCTTTLGFKL